MRIRKSQADFELPGRESLPKNFYSTTCFTTPEVLGKKFTVPA